MILGATLPIPLLYLGINVAGYSWRDSSCPGPGHHKEPGWTVHCCPPQEGQHPLLGPFLPTCLSLPESCLEALAPEQTQRLHQCCLPGHAAPPLTDQILSGLQIGPIWTQSHCQQSVSTSQQRHLQSGVSCRENSSPLLSPLPHPSICGCYLGPAGCAPADSHAPEGPVQGEPQRQPKH